MDANEAELPFKRIYARTSLQPQILASFATHPPALDHLPLAIVGAAAYTQTTGTVPTEYPKVLNPTGMEKARLLVEEFNDARRELQNDGSTDAFEEERMTERVLTTYYITF